MKLREGDDEGASVYLQNISITKYESGWLIMTEKVKEAMSVADIYLISVSLENSSKIVWLKFTKKRKVILFY